MNDKFLYQLREQPDSTFSIHLHAKLNQLDPERNRWNNLKIIPNLFSKKAVQYLAVFALTLLALITISPVRAYLSSLAADLGGQLFEITEDYPGDNSAGDEVIIKPQVMTLEDAQSAYPHEFQLPDEIPSGFILNRNQVRVYLSENIDFDFPNLIELEWASNQRGGFLLSITDRDADTSEIIAPDSAKEIFLDQEHTAVLIQGGWDADQHDWDPDLGIRLRWVVNGLTYDLHSSTEILTEALLIKIAQSTLD